MKKIAVVGLCLVMAMAGCQTTGDGKLSPEAVEILVTGATEAIAAYLAVKVTDPTPEQVLIISLARTAMQLAILQVRQAGAIAQAERLEAMAIDPEPEAELEPLEP